MARTGWVGIDELISKAEKFPMPILKKVKNACYQYDIAGGVINMSRHLAGVPDCMLRMRQNPAFSMQEKFKKILFTFDMHGGYEPIEMVAAGYRAYEVAQLMESINIRTEIIFHARALAQGMSFVPEQRTFISGYYDVYVTIKKKDEVLNKEKLMFALAHPSFLRRLVFSEMEKNPSEVINYFGFKTKCGYGYTDVLNRDSFYDNSDVMYMVASDVFNDKNLLAQNNKIYAMLRERGL